MYDIIYDIIKNNNIFYAMDIYADWTTFVNKYFV